MFANSQEPTAEELLKKKRPHFWGHRSKEARGRKSGTAIEGRCLLRKQLVSRVGYTEEED